MARHTKLSGFVKDGKAAKSKVIKVVTLFQLLKAKPELGADNFAIDIRISLAEKSFGPVSVIASQSGTHAVFMSLCRAD